MTLIIIIFLICLVIYFYYQNQRLKTTGNRSASSGDNQTSSTTQVIFDNWESQTASVITSLEQEVQDLTSERDEAIREKQTLEQDLLATTNRLKNKSQEAEAKASQIELLKKEKSQSEIALNKTITELRTKYSKQGKLLDTEQLEGKKAFESLEQLKREYSSQLRSINLLFGFEAESYEAIDFKKLYALLKNIAQKELPGSFPKENKDD